ncbi:MAG TPA: hypothetical protein VLH35_05005 [Candidatus Acidoferrales bacterium]|nr:hypothetical protein [Candidatus Acidoferrales bacterium]
MNTLERVWLMIKLLKENYDNALSIQQRMLMGPHPRQLSNEEKQVSQIEAKKVVCEVGITMYQFNKYLKSRYKKTAENEAIHLAVKQGEELGLLKLGNPRRYDADKGLQGQNIVLTEEGFIKIFDQGFYFVINATHAMYAANPRRKY